MGLGVEAEADWDHLRTPETYLGYGRSQRFASPGGAAFDQRRAYQLPGRLRFNHWALAGQWTIGREKVVVEQAGGSIAYRFHARDAHLVLSGGRHHPIAFRVLLDGEAPGPSHGVDVDEDGNGLLREGRLYQLVREHDAVRERTLEITFLFPAPAAQLTTARSTPRHLAGDEVERFQLRAVAGRMLGSLTEADDALQDAWERVSRRAPRLRAPHDRRPRTRRQARRTRPRQPSASAWVGVSGYRLLST